MSRNGRRCNDRTTLGLLALRSLLGLREDIVGVDDVVAEGDYFFGRDANFSSHSALEMGLSLSTILTVS